MPDHDHQSRSTLESPLDECTEASGSHEASLDNRVSACERLVDEAVEKGWSAKVLANALKELGLKAIEATDYLEELGQRLEIRRAKARDPGSPHHEPPLEVMSSFSSEKNSFLSTWVTATFFIHSFIHSFIH